MFIAVAVAIRLKPQKASLEQRTHTHAIICFNVQPRAMKTTIERLTKAA